MQEYAKLDRLLGVVVIGRNEGPRLAKCLASITGGYARVYVDSGSTDDSVQVARSLGADVLELDPSRPFAAARGRNEGFQRLLQLHPELRYVQFVDGDCEIRDGWFEQGRRALENDESIVAVCGRLRERFPERSVYIRLCDMAWDVPPGEVDACGGVAIYRVSAFIASRGFNESLLVGEEYELCARLRLAGGRILRLGAEMALHDVGITRFSQWWKRAARAGYAYAEGCTLLPEAFRPRYRRNVLRVIVWGTLAPLLAVAGLLVSAFWEPSALISLFTLAALSAQVLRLAIPQYSGKGSPMNALVFGAFLLLVKMPESQGVFKFWFSPLRGRRAGIIEYR